MKNTINYYPTPEEIEKIKEDIKNIEMKPIEVDTQIDVFICSKNKEDMKVFTTNATLETEYGVRKDEPLDVDGHILSLSTEWIVKEYLLENSESIQRHLEDTIPNLDQIDGFYHYTFDVNNYRWKERE